MVVMIKISLKVRICLSDYTGQHFWVVMPDRMAFGHKLFFS